MYKYPISAHMCAPGTYALIMLRSYNTLKEEEKYFFAGHSALVSLSAYWAP